MTEIRPRGDLPPMLQSIQDFLRLEAAGGFILMAAAALALVVANSPLAGAYASLLDVPVEVRVGSAGIDKPLLLWINDGLMAVFFLLVGLELKREVLEGHLSSLRQASLPAFAAAGGMLAPALLYAAIARGDPAALAGWAIPTATDIAFALGVLSLLGDRVPPALKVFLLSVAIFDDLGAVVVIALFYTDDLSATSLTVAATLITGMVVLNRLGVVRPAAYFVLGVPLWVAVLKSGVHATLAGVVLALLIPLPKPLPDDYGMPRRSAVRELEHALHPWVAFGVLPLFAFANAGVGLLGVRGADLAQPVALGIIAGLFVGKPLGVLLACWLAIRLRLAALPDGCTWAQVAGIAVLCGVGFTMSLFIASLAFAHGDVAYGGFDRLGILVGSLLSGGVGALLLHRVLPRP